MIKFGSNNKVENIGILEKEEAKAYIYFLAFERFRHAEEIVACERLIKSAEYWHPRRYIPMREFRNSAIRRHKKDIGDIDVLVETLKHRYAL